MINAKGMSIYLRVGFVCRLGEYIILTGESSHRFTACARNCANPVKICMNTAETGAEQSFGINRFFALAFKNNNAPEIIIDCDWGGTVIPLKISQISIADFGPAHVGIPSCKYAAILASLPVFSPEWHALLKFVPLEIFENRQILKFSQPLRASLKEVLRNYKNIGASLQATENGQGWICGKVLLNDCAFAETFDLYLDDWQIEAGLDISRNSFSFPASIAAAQIDDSASLLTLVHTDSGDIADFVYLRKNSSTHDFVLHLDIMDSRLAGWSVDRLNRDDEYYLKIFIDGVFFDQIKNDQYRSDLLELSISGGRGGFVCGNPVGLMRNGMHSIRFQFPDKSFSASFQCLSENAYDRLLWNVERINRRVSIIIPIYNASDELAICLEHLYRYTRPPYRLILIDDSSTDPAIGEILAIEAATPHVVVLRNAHNLGYSGSINRGIMEAGNDDVVILNSDVRVTPRWLEGILVAADSGEKIATVTPMSNRAGSFSAPRMGNRNPLPEDAGECGFARSFRREGLGLYPQTPTGNGFCMYIDRKCLKEIGLFDEDAFPRGYGEENDFCMRAMRAGWRNVIDDKSYVFHERGKSFGGARHALRQAGTRVVKTRYPEYAEAIKIFSSGMKMRLARYGAEKAAKNWRANTRPRILFAMSARSRHAIQNIKCELSALGGDAQCFLLTAEGKRLSLYEFQVERLRFQLGYCLENAPLAGLGKEYDAFVGAAVYDFDIDIVYIQEIYGHSVKLPQIARLLGRTAILNENVLLDDYLRNCAEGVMAKALDNCAALCGDGQAARKFFRQFPFLDAPPIINSLHGNLERLLDGAQ